jgi:glycogen(starch) synthase
LGSGAWDGGETVRVVMVSAEYPDEVSGGIATHIYYLSRELVRRGHDVHLVTSVRQGPAWAPAEGMKVHFIPFFQGLLVRNVLWTSASRVAVARLGFRPDVVHAHAPMCSLYPLLHARRVPLVTTFHSLFYKFREVPGETRADILLARIGELSDRLSLSSSDMVMACSPSIHQEILQTRFPADRVVMIPNGVPMSDYATRRPEQELEDARRRFRLPAAKFLVLTVGALIPRKGIDILLGALRLLEARAPGRFGLLVVGDGPDRPALESLARPLADRVAFAGRVPLEDLRRLYQLSDIFAMPSHYEGLPTVVLEALATGLPVVGSDIPSLHGLLEACGRLVERTPEAFADAIGSLLADDDAVRRMREAAPRAAEPYSWERLAVSVERAYESAVA